MQRAALPQKGLKAARTEWPCLRTRSSLAEKYEYTFVMDCKAKADLVVTERYMSPEELSNQFQSF